MLQRLSALLHHLCFFVSAGVQRACGGSNILQCQEMSLLPSLQTLAVGAMCPT